MTTIEILSQIQYRYRDVCRDEEFEALDDAIKIVGKWELIRVMISRYGMQPNLAHAVLKFILEGEK